MAHNPVALFQFTLDWQAPTAEVEQGFYLRDSITPEVAFIRSQSIPMSVKPGGTIGAPFFNPLGTLSKLTFMGFEVRNLANNQYIYVEQDSEINVEGGATVLFDGGVGKQIGSDLSFNAGTGVITSAAGGLFLGYAVLNLAQG